MKKRKLSKRTLALFAAALVLFGSGGYMGTSAILNTFSDAHLLNIDTDDAGVSLVGEDFNAAKLISDDTAVPGKAYAKNISVRNDTETKQFVRVVVRKYWEKKDDNGNYQKVTKDLPEKAMEMLKFDFGTDGWKANDAEKTAEREVYCYTSAVGPKDTTKVLIKSFKVSPEVLDELTSTTEGNVTTYTYAYDGYKVGIDIEAQSVQTHNGTEAIKSIWGVQNITASGDSLSF